MYNLYFPRPQFIMASFIFVINIILFLISLPTRISNDTLQQSAMIQLPVLVFTVIIILSLRAINFDNENMYIKSLIFKKRVKVIPLSNVIRFEKWGFTLGMAYSLEYFSDGQIKSKAFQPNIETFTLFKQFVDNAKSKAV